MNCCELWRPAKLERLSDLFPRTSKNGIIPPFNNSTCKLSLVISNGGVECVVIPFSSRSCVRRNHLDTEPVPRKSLSLCSGAERNAFEKCCFGMIAKITVHWDAWQEAIGRQNSFFTLFGWSQQQLSRIHDRFFGQKWIAFEWSSCSVFYKIFSLFQLLLI